VTVLPKVTVLMPVFNGEPYLSEAIASILGQTFTDFELLIIDDGSTDRSRQIVRSLNDPRVRLLCNDGNLRLIATLNRGLDEAHGMYVARMDADDISLPGRLEAQVAFLDLHPEIGVLGTGIQIIDAFGVPGTEILLPGNNALIRWNLALRSPLAHPTVMMRRSIIAAIGGYRTEPLHCEDYDLWWRASQVTRIANLPTVLLRLRKHGESVTSQFVTDHDENGRRVCQEMLEDALSLQLTVDLVAAMWGQVEASELQLAEGLEVMTRHFRTCMYLEPISANEREALQREFTAWVYRFANGHAAAGHGGLWKMLAKVRRYAGTARNSFLTSDERFLIRMDAARRAWTATMQALRIGLRPQ
jgi:hypothetical protein